MISDPMWKESFLNGEIIEESNYGYYKTILVKSNCPTGHLYYPLRIFFFENENEPSFAVNLENSGFSEELVLGVHGYIKHYNYGTVDTNISVDEFKSKALSLAEKHIGPPTKNKVVGKRSAKEIIKEIDELFSE